jgi:hypothetical protein
MAYMTFLGEQCLEDVAMYFNGLYSWGGGKVCIRAVFVQLLEPIKLRLCLVTKYFWSFKKNIIIL